MKFEPVMYCHWDIFRFLEEEHIAEENSTVSMTDGQDIELMIFLSKQEYSQGYEVRVYKTETEFDKFDFDDFASAHEFMDNLPYEHPEYEERPTRKINKNNYANM